MDTSIDVTRMPEFGVTYDPNEEVAVPRLNMPIDRLDGFLTEQEARARRAGAKLHALIQQAEEAVGPRDHMETWIRVKAEFPDLHDAIGDAERKAVNVAESVRMNALAVIAETSASSMVLPDDEQERAATLMPLMRAEIDALPIPELRAKLRLAVSRNDVAAMYVFSSLLPARLAAGAKMNADGTASRELGDPDVLQDVRHMISHTRSMLADKSLAPLHKRARALQATAERVKQATELRRRTKELGAMYGGARRK